MCSVVPSDVGSGEETGVVSGLVDLSCPKDLKKHWDCAAVV